MSRVTSTMIDAKIQLINKLTGHTGPLWRQEGKRNIASIGMYYYTACLNSHQLAQIANEDGGIRVILYASTKSELYGKLGAFLEGMAVKA